jgi:GLPGLI family protein
MKWIMMNRLILLIVLLGICLHAASQHFYRATYTSKAPAVFDIQIEFDSTSDDKEDTADLKALVQNWLGRTIETTIVLTTQSESSEIELIPQKKVESERVIYSGAKYKWDRGNLFLFKADLGKFVPSNKKTVFLTYTGVIREILGYTCKEAKTHATDSIQVTAWICEKLPSLINPAVPIKGVAGAVFEYIEKGGDEIVIKKIESL